MALTDIFGRLDRGLDAASLAEAAIVVCYAGLLIVLALVCQSDAKHRKVSNRLIAVIAALGIVEALVTGDLWTPMHIIMITATALLLVCLWQVRMLGGADVKLILACLVWIEPQDAGIFAALVATLGALLGIAIFATRQTLVSATKRRILSRDRGGFYLSLMAWRDCVLGTHASVPYAIAIACAQVVTLAMSAS